MSKEEERIPQNKYSFEEAKNKSLELLGAIETFYEYMNKGFPDAGILDWLEKIRNVKGRVHNSSAEIILDILFQCL